MALEGKRVTAPIVMHGNWGDNYDDPSHPIPSLTALDVHAIKKTGGSDLVIVIAFPLQADERSQRRLLDKIEIYLRFLKTPEFESSSGVASPETTSIVIRIHPNSDPAVFDLIERCRSWIHSNGASLETEALDA
jgi:hypothetical protein